MSHKRKLRRKLGKDKKDSIVATFTAIGDGFSVVYDPLRDRVEFPGVQVEQIHQVIHYERTSGKEKTVASVPCDEKRGHFSQRKSLIANVDFLFAVDTNTTEIDGRRVSFSVCYCVPHILSSYGSTVPFSPFVAFEINEVCPEVNPERVGWHLLITQILEADAYDPKYRIGIVVDSELGLHPGINRREIAYYADYYYYNATSISSDTW